MEFKFEMLEWMQVIEEEGHVLSVFPLISCLKHFFTHIHVCGNVNTEGWKVMRLTSW